MNLAAVPTVRDMLAPLREADSSGGGLRLDPTIATRQVEYVMIEARPLESAKRTLHAESWTAASCQERTVGSCVLVERPRRAGK